MPTDLKQEQPRPKKNFATHYQQALRTQAERVASPEPEVIVLKIAKRRGPKPQAECCWHWCLVGRHDWHHELRGGQGRNASLDEWEMTCPEHQP